MNQPPEFSPNKLLSRWMLNSFYISLALAVVFFITAMPMSYLLRHGMSKQSMDMVGKFWNVIVQNPDHLFSLYGKWFGIIWRSDASGLWFWIPLLPFITIPVGLLIGYLTCPYRERRLFKRIMR